MIDPVKLAQQERNQQSAIALAKHLQQQRQEDNTTTFTGFWQRYDKDQKLHVVKKVDGSIVWCESGVPTGFAPGQAVTVSQARGQLYGKIRVMR